MYGHIESYAAADDFLIYLGKKKAPRKFVVFSRWIQIPSQGIYVLVKLWHEQEDGMDLYFYDVDKFFKETGFYGVLINYPIFETHVSKTDLDLDEIDFYIDLENYGGGVIKKGIEKVDTFLDIIYLKNGKKKNYVNLEKTKKLVDYAKGKDIYDKLKEGFVKVEKQFKEGLDNFRK